MIASVYIFGNNNIITEQDTEDDTSKIQSALFFSSLNQQTPLASYPRHHPTIHTLGSVQDLTYFCEGSAHCSGREAGMSQRIQYLWPARKTGRPTILTCCLPGCRVDGLPEHELRPLVYVRTYVYTWTAILTLQYVSLRTPTSTLATHVLNKLSSNPITGMAYHNSAAGRRLRER